MIIRWFIVLALLCMGLGAQGRANMSVRLLSCNDLASAKELSQLVKDRIIYASDGWVELFEDGTIASQNVFKKIVNGAEKETLAKYTSTSNKAKVRLGDGVISNIDGFDDLLKNDYFKSTFENLDKGLLIRKFAQYNVTFAEENQIFDFQGRFTSSSVTLSEADQFRVGGGGDVIWSIKSKTGVDLTLINSSEEEVLFKPLVKYKLIDIDRSNSSYIIYNIIEQ